MKGGKKSPGGPPWPVAALAGRENPRPAEEGRRQGRACLRCYRLQSHPAGSWEARAGDKAGSMFGHRFQGCPAAAQHSRRQKAEARVHAGGASSRNGLRQVPHRLGTWLKKELAHITSTQAIVVLSCTPGYIRAACSSYYTLVQNPPKPRVRSVRRQGSFARQDGQPTQLLLRVQGTSGQGTCRITP